MGAAAEASQGHGAGAEAQGDGLFRMAVLLLSLLVWGCWGLFGGWGLEVVWLFDSGFKIPATARRVACCPCLANVTNQYCIPAESPVKGRNSSPLQAISF